MASLLALLQAQDDLQRNTFGHKFEEMSGEEKIEYIRWNMLSLMNELHEALDETDWKPWADLETRGLNLDAYVSELVDAFHFFMNLLLATGVDPNELAPAFTSRYFTKRDKNIQRQAEGYDGKSGKCPQCRRDLEDPGVTCTSSFCSITEQPAIDLN
jgi:dUTPase-like protein